MKRNYLIALVVFLFSLCGVFVNKFYSKNTQYKLASYKLSECLAQTPLKDFMKHKGVIVKDVNGFYVILNGKDDCVSYTIFTSKQWEPHVQNALKRLVKPGHKVLTLGGHIGYHALLISKIVGETGKLFVFEPNPESLKFLKANMAINDVKNCTIYPMAAFSHKTSLSFNAIIDGNTGSSHVDRKQNVPDNSENYITVDAINLDSMPEIDSIDILQMDIEGAEYEAVIGAQKLIDNSPNLIVIQEYSPAWLKDIDSYLKFWRSRGYCIAQIRNSDLIEMTDDELKKTSNQIDIVLCKNLQDVLKKFSSLQ
jgi:FkbM family methyltransferase